MRTQPMAAWRGALFNVLFIAICVISLPMVAQARSVDRSDFDEKSTLIPTAPAEQALGMGSNCGDCHSSGQIDWQALDWTDDPFEGGQRVEASQLPEAILGWRPPMQSGLE